MASGPLNGVKVVEMAGIGAAPLAVTILSDMGADVVRVDRQAGRSGNPLSGTKFELDGRGRRSVALDLKNPAEIDICLDLFDRADLLLEGFRPGVMERLGLGPDIALGRNPRLIYGRMTGWGQDGPYAQMAGHDYNYIAITGAAFATGVADRPVPPLNYLGDYAGALVLVAGLLAAMHHVGRTGRGQVVDAAMCEAGSYLSGLFHALRQAGHWRDERGANELDGGAPYYRAYRCSDGEWISIASIEPQFYATLLRTLQLPPGLAETQRDRSTWPALADMLGSAIAGKTQAEWCAIMEGTDICFAPIVRFGEAPDHPQMKARGAFVTIDGVVQPAPVPRFGGTPAAVQGPPPRIGEHSESALLEWGINPEKIAAFIRDRTR